MTDKQTIRAGAESTNVQATDITFNQYNGLSYADAKEIAKDAAMEVFRSNFYELGDRALQVARERAEEITNDFLEKLQMTSPEKIKNLEDPDLQYAFFEVQKSYARLGDKEISDLMVEVLIERTCIEEQSFMKLVLNEALEIIPKLTKKQIDILSLSYVMRYLNFIPELKIPFDHYYAFLNPFIKDVEVPENEMFYRHLEYSGCISISIGSADFKSIMSNKFSYLSDEILNEIIQAEPDLVSFIDKWNNTKLCNISLTSVGIAIAMSNTNRRLGVKWDLNVWINE